MFPDSGIAQMTKFAYTINGLAPFFFPELIEKIKKSPVFTISFNESLNDHLEKIQTNFIIRFRDLETKTIATRYYDSMFLCYCNANALKQSFDKALEELDTKILLQVAME